MWKRSTVVLWRSQQVPLEGWLQVLLVAGLIETQLFKEPVWPVLPFFTVVSPCFPCFGYVPFRPIQLFRFLCQDYYVFCPDFCFNVCVAFASIFSFYWNSLLVCPGFASTKMPLVCPLVLAFCFWLLGSTTAADSPLSLSCSEQDQSLGGFAYGKYGLLASEAGYTYTQKSRFAWIRERMR